MKNLSPNIILDYISEEQENCIVQNLALNHYNLTFGKGEGKRTGIFRYGLKRLHPDRLVSEFIPDYLSLDIGLTYNSVTINKYEAGDIIDWHIDKPKTGEIITILSLLSDAELKFREKKNRTNTFEIELPRRSLTRLQGTVRYDWEHYLKAEEKRWSIVYRNIES